MSIDKLKKIRSQMLTTIKGYDYLYKDEFAYIDIFEKLPISIDENFFETYTKDRLFFILSAIFKSFFNLIKKTVTKNIIIILKM